MSTTPTLRPLLQFLGSVGSSGVKTKTSTSELAPFPFLWVETIVQVFSIDADVCVFGGADTSAGDWCTVSSFVALSEAGTTCVVVVIS
jgi:hypothetical protein